MKHMYFKVSAGNSTFFLLWTKILQLNKHRPFQKRAWSCITSYPLQGLPYPAYHNVNPAMVNNMMLRSSMHGLKRSIINFTCLLISQYSYFAYTEAVKNKAFILYSNKHLIALLYNMFYLTRFQELWKG